MRTDNKEQYKTRTVKIANGQVVERKYIPRETKRETPAHHYNDSIKDNVREDMELETKVRNILNFLRNKKIDATNPIYFAKINKEEQSKISRVKFILETRIVESILNNVQDDVFFEYCRTYFSIFSCIKINFINATDFIDFIKLVIIGYIGNGSEVTKAYVDNIIDRIERIFAPSDFYDRLFYHLAIAICYLFVDREYSDVYISQVTKDLQESYDSYISTIDDKVSRLKMYLELQSLYDILDVLKLLNSSDNIESDYDHKISVLIEKATQKISKVECKDLKDLYILFSRFALFYMNEKWNNTLLKQDKTSSEANDFRYSPENSGI